MSIDWYPIPTPAAGRLAIVARPRGGDWLADDTRRWKQAGIDIVVSLLMPHEAEELGLADEASAVEAAGMKFISFPIDDRGIPSRREPFEELVVALSQACGYWRNGGRALPPGPRPGPAHSHCHPQGIGHRNPSRD